LERICGYKQEYIEFVLCAHIVGEKDIYGSHLPKSTIAIPIQFLHLSPIYRVYYNLTFSLLGWAIGQTIDNNMVLPPCWSFMLFRKMKQREVGVGEVSPKQRLREVERMEGIIKCIERKNK
jgi:hypothetical protein